MTQIVTAVRERIGNRTFIASVLVLAVCLVSYLALSAGLPGTFLLDDISRIQSADLKTLSIDELAAAIARADSGLFGRPLSLASLYITKATHGGEPAAFRHENVLLHLLVTLVIFWFIARLLHAPSCGLTASVAPGTIWLVAAIPTALWALHPLHVSTVLYAVQRMTQLSTLFVFCALLTYIIARQQPRFDIRVAISSLAIVGLFTLLGLWSKEPAVLIPCFILLLEFLIFRFSVNDSGEKRNLLAFHLVSVIIPLLAGTAYILYRLDWILHDYVMRDFTVWERLATEPVILWQYVGMLLLPRLSDMTLYHDTMQAVSPLDPSAWIAIAAWIATAVVAIAFRMRAPLACFGILFFLVGHALESSFLPLELMFEHRNYLPAVGIFLLVVGIPLHLPRSRSVAAYSAVLFVGLALLFGSMQWIRASAWRDTTAMHMIVLQDHPGSVRAASELANQSLREGRLGLARHFLERAIENSNGNRLPGLRVHLLATYCFEDRIPEDPYQAALEALAEHPLGPYAVSGLDAFRQRANEGKCPAITSNQIIRLFAVAADNERTRGSHSFVTNAIVGIALLNSEAYPRAREYLQRAMEFESEAPPHLRIQATLKLAQACREMKDDECHRKAIRKSRRLIEDSPYALPTESEMLDLIADTSVVDLE